MTQSNDDDFHFSKWINDSFLEVAKKAIKVVEQKQTTSSYSFYITFVSADKDVIIPQNLIEQYPDIMTIVLENQFDNLKIDSKGFHVTLSFQGIPANLYIPWKSMVSFVEKKLDLHMLFNYVPNFKTKAQNKINTSDSQSKIKKLPSSKTMSNKNNVNKATTGKSKVSSKLKNNKENNIISFNSLKED